MYIIFEAAGDQSSRDMCQFQATSKLGLFELLQRWTVISSLTNAMLNPAVPVPGHIQVEPLRTPPPPNSLRKSQEITSFPETVSIDS